MLDITFEETRVYQEIKEEAPSLMTKLLAKRFGSLEEDLRSAIAALPLQNLEELSEILLELDSLEELKSWLAQQLTQSGD